MIKVLYYYYYLFYTKIIPDDEPHATVIWTLSLSIALIIDFFLSLFAAVIFGIFLRKWVMLIIFALVLVSLYLTLYRTKKCVAIVNEKPKFFNNNTISIILTIVFFLASIAPVFFLVPIVRQIIY
jgi:hypothetical protein